MHITFLESFISRVYLAVPEGAASGSKGVPLFRPNDKNSKRIWHKPVPKLRTDDLVGAWYFMGELVAPEEMVRILPHVTVPVDAPWHPKTFESDAAIEHSALRLADEVRERVVYLQGIVRKPMLNRLRQRLITQMVERMCRRAELPVDQAPRAVLEAVALLMDCGLITVQRALERAHGVPAKGDGKPKAHREDARWKAVLNAVAKARSTAYQLDMRSPMNAPKISGKFSGESVLIERRGEYLYPERCPIVGVWLEYDRFAHPKAPNLVCVGRLDTRTPYAAGNVALMSTLGRKVQEGKVHKSQLNDDQRQVYDKFVGAHSLVQTPPEETYRTYDADLSDIINKLPPVSDELKELVSGGKT